MIASELVPVILPSVTVVWNERHQNIFFYDVTDRPIIIIIIIITDLYSAFRSEDTEALERSDQS